MRAPSDKLPLFVLAGIVMCFVLHFGTRFMKQAQTYAALPATPDWTTGEGFDLEICNATAESRVYVAVAYFDKLRNDWVARGWFPQRQGECQTAMRQLTPPVYVFAETKDGRANWKAEGKTVEFCIDRDKAFVEGQSTCAHGTKQTFAELSLSGAKDGESFRWEVKDVAH